jgi:hypothetical protein
MFANAVAGNMLFPGMRTYAPWPVWRDSVAGSVRWAPMTKRQARAILDDLQRWERQTRTAGRQDGVIGRNGLAVARVLLLKFMNWQTGRCDPSIASIAAEAAISPKSAERGLAKLKAAGAVNWLRRCVGEAQAAGGFLMRQISNAYAVLPSSQWKGYRASCQPCPPYGPTTSPRPEPGTWGDHPPSDPYAEAKGAGDLAGRIAALEADGSAIAAIHARVLRAQLMGGAAGPTEGVSLTKKPADRFIPRGPG